MLVLMYADAPMLVECLVEILKSKCKNKQRKGKKEGRKEGRKEKERKEGRKDCVKGIHIGMGRDARPRGSGGAPSIRQQNARCTYCNP